MKTKKILAALAAAAMGTVLAAPLSAAAEEKGTSDATVKVNEGTPTPSGVIQFSNVSTSAKIIFEDKTIDGSLLTANEKTAGNAKINLNDSRENLAAGNTGAYQVFVKDVTPTTNANSFRKNNLALKLASTNNGKGNHTNTSSVTVGDQDQLVFSGVYEAGITEKSVTLNPTLTIPAALTVAGDYQANLQWTLTFDL